MIIQPMPYPAGGTVDYAYAENLSGVAEAAGAYTDLATLSFTAEAADYMIFWNTNGSLGSTTDVQGQLLDNGVSVADMRSFTSQSTPPDKHNLGGLRIITGNGAARTFKTQGRRGAAGTATFTQSRISALKIGPDDEYATSMAEQTTTSASYVTMATLNFTPPSAGDYYIIYAFKCGPLGSSTVPVRYECTDGTSTIGGDTAGFVHNVRDDTISNYNTFIHVSKLTGVTGAQTATIKGRSATGGTSVKFKDCVIVAIRADRFADTYFTRLNAHNNGTQTSYTTALSQTFTPDAEAHLTIMGAAMSPGTSSESGYAQMLDDAETLSESIIEDSASVGTWGHQIETYAASSRTQAIQRKSETSADNFIMNGASILCLSLAGMTGG